MLPAEWWAPAPTPGGVQASSPSTLSSLNALETQPWDYYPPRRAQKSTPTKQRSRKCCLTLSASAKKKKKSEKVDNRTSCSPTGCGRRCGVHAVWAARC